MYGSYKKQKTTLVKSLKTPFIKALKRLHAMALKPLLFISKEDYQRLQTPKDSLVEFFQKSPLRGVKLNLKRDDNTGREVSFWNIYSTPA